MSGSSDSVVRQNGISSNDVLDVAFMRSIIEITNNFLKEKKYSSETKNLFLIEWVGWAGPSA